MTHIEKKVEQQLAVVDPPAAPEPISERDLKIVLKMATMLIKTHFVPKSLREQGPEAALACILAGRELGLGPMQSLRSIDIVEGKPALNAALQGALIRRHGHSLTVKNSENAATAHGKRADNGDEGTFTYTMDMARRAGLVAKPAWKANPEQMLGHRALTSLGRQLFQDVFVSFAYLPDEVEEIAKLEAQRSGTKELSSDSSETVQEALPDPLDRTLTEEQRTELKALFGQPVDAEDLRKGWSAGTLEALKEAIARVEERVPAIKHASKLSELTQRHFDEIMRENAPSSEQVVDGEAINDDDELDKSEPGSLT